MALQQRLRAADARRARSALGETPLLATLTPASILEKWRQGLPALRNEVDCRSRRPQGHPAADLHGAGRRRRRRQRARTSGTRSPLERIDADSLLSVSLARNQKAIRTSALHMGFSPDLVWLIGELGSAPLAHRLSAGLKASTTRVMSADDDGRSADLQVGLHGTAATARSAARGRRSSKRTATRTRCAARIARSAWALQSRPLRLLRKCRQRFRRRRAGCERSRNGASSCAGNAAATRK